LKRLPKRPPFSLAQAILPPVAAKSTAPHSRMEVTARYVTKKYAKKHPGRVDDRAAEGA